MVSTKKYFIYTIFLVSPISLSLYAQNTAEQPTKAAVSCNASALCSNQIQTAAGSLIENSNQFIVGQSNPKDSLTIAAEAKTAADCQENSSSVVSTSILAKDIIENYKYDFSETFIDILFFERIDLSRTRNI
ncbi:hypothetical protein [Flavobacterium foetidum]|uniref:hypothetical protein n=1 Tax=Flavobacterium foetidum TaxID=2026681 RepID=UPI001FC99A0C|nr:hypothetical protein [Flavobacterium foetidum]